MSLNERKIKILEAIISDYIQTAEPIGSRTIAKKYAFGLSSATIRNEMSDLEDMGLIIQPHASAGRVPSDKGYRFYVDQLMQTKEVSHEHAVFLQQLVIKNISQIDYLMQETAKALSLLTNYTTIVTEPQTKKTRIKHIQLVPLDETSIILVLITDNKVVKNHTIKVENAPEYATLNDISIKLNNMVQGVAIEEIDDILINKLIDECSELKNLIIPVVNTIVSAVHSDDEINIYTSGAKNILGFPEFSDLDKARTIFQALEEKEMLYTLLGSDISDTVQIIIGAENTVEQMKNCSIIKTNYKLGSQTFGSIGIIGPTRMDYPQVVSMLKSIVKSINSVLKTLSGG